MQAGNLRKRITIQQKVGTRDSYGQAVSTWSDIAIVWAEVESLSGGEALRGLQEESETKLKVTVRYRSELADPRAVNAWRFNFEGRTLNIEACMFQDMKKRYVTLLCGEGLSDGQ